MSVLVTGSVGRIGRNKLFPSWRHKTKIRQPECFNFDGVSSKYKKAAVNCLWTTEKKKFLNKNEI